MMRENDKRLDELNMFYKTCNRELEIANNNVENNIREVNNMYSFLNDLLEKNENPKVVLTAYDSILSDLTAITDITRKFNIACELRKSSKNCNDMITQYTKIKDNFTYLKPDLTKYHANYEGECVITHIKDKNQHLFYINDLENTKYNKYNKLLKEYKKKSPQKYIGIPGEGEIFGLYIKDYLLRVVRENDQCDRNNTGSSSRSGSKLNNLLLIDVGEIVKFNEKEMEIYPLPYECLLYPGQAILCKLKMFDSNTLKIENVLSRILYMKYKFSVVSKDESLLYINLFSETNPFLDYFLDDDCEDNKHRTALMNPFRQYYCNNEENEINGTEVDDFLVDISNLSSNALQTASNLSSNALQTASNLSSNALQTASNLSSNALQTASNLSSNALQTASNLPSNALQTASNLSSNALQTASNLSSNALQTASNLSSNALQTASNLPSNTLQTASNLSSNALQTASNLPSNTLQTASNLLENNNFNMNMNYNCSSNNIFENTLLQNTACLMPNRLNMPNMSNMLHIEEITDKQPQQQQNGLNLFETYYQNMRNALPSTSSSTPDDRLQYNDNLMDQNNVENFETNILNSVSTPGERLKNFYEDILTQGVQKCDDPYTQNVAIESLSSSMQQNCYIENKSDQSNEIVRYNSCDNDYEPVFEIRAKSIMPSVGETITIIPTEVVYAHMFFGHIECHEVRYQATLSELIRHMNLPEEIIKFSQINRPLVKYELVLAMYKDESWYRGRIVNIYDENIVKVFFLDYANAEILSLDKIRKWEKRFEYLPIQAIACKIFGIEGKTLTVVGLECVKKLLINKKFKAKVIKISRDYLLEVKLMDAGGNDMGNELVLLKYAYKAR